MSLFSSVRLDIYILQCRNVNVFDYRLLPQTAEDLGGIRIETVIESVGPC